MNFLNRFANLPLILHGGMTLAAIGAFQAVRLRLDASYAASGHPVDYATGQTTFDADKIKGFYAHMQELGTLDIYLRTQIIDFGFIAMMMVFGLCQGTLVARAGAKGSWGRRLGFWAAILAVTGASFDVAENLVSFVMLADPQDFAGWLALPYSGFAAAKFICLTAAMALVPLSLIVSGTAAIKGRIAARA
jgi:hypothetical protein